MPDLGTRWQIVEKQPIGRGGQGHAYLVKDRQQETDQLFVAKVLNGANLNTESPRWKRLEHEVEVARSFEHPNVIRLVDSGHTATSSFPFFVMPLYQGGSLDNEQRQKLGDPASIFEFFAEICDGVAYVHSKGIVHRDLKPANILLDALKRPIVGDFGLCFRFEAESLTEPMEVATARWFGAPELRDGHCEEPPLSSDVYSLGKLLYWLLSGNVHDSHEQDYGRPDRKLGVLRKDEPAYAWADELVAQTVKYEPKARVLTAADLAKRARSLAQRVLAGGRHLDIRIPQRCLYCAAGTYTPIGELGFGQQRYGRSTYPDVETRRKIRPGMESVVGDNENPYTFMKEAIHGFLGHGYGPVNQGAMLILVCNYCGNMQQFRFDRTTDGHGENWRP
jgi:serine/threonine protein kinase